MSSECEAEAEAEAEAEPPPTPPLGGGRTLNEGFATKVYLGGGGPPPQPDFGLFLRDVSSETLILVIEPWDVSGETAL